MRALARRRLIVHPHTLANLYAIALVMPPLGAAWLVATTFLPVWWLSEMAFEGAHQWPLHDVHLLAGVLGETERQLAVASAALLTALIAALIVADLRGRVAARRALDALPGSCPRTHRPRTAQALSDFTTPGARGRLRFHVIPADYPVAFVWGLRRTKLVLSSGLIALLSRDQLHAVVAHERAHHDRCDNVARLMLLVCPYTSLAMPLSRRVLTWYSEQAELVCDEVAARATGAPLDLASALVSIRRSTLARPPLEPVAMPEISALQEVVDRFLRRNLTVEAARQRVDMARAERIASRLRPNPTVTFLGDQFALSGPTPFSQLYELSATYAQPIERSEKRRLRGEVGELTVSVAEAQLADVLRQRLAPR